MKKQKKNGMDAERRAQRRLKRFLSSLSSIVVPGSGALAHRDGGNDDPQYVGDLQIRTARHRTVEFIEVKEQSATITIATMDRMRRGRRILMCHHPYGEFVVSIWRSVWDELHAMCGEKPISIERRAPTRAVTLMDVQGLIRHFECYGPLYAVQWGKALYMDDRAFAALLEESHGDGYRYPCAAPESESEAEDTPEGFQRQEQPHD